MSRGENCPSSGLGGLEKSLVHLTLEPGSRPEPNFPPRPRQAPHPPSTRSPNLPDTPSPHQGCQQRCPDDAGITFQLVPQPLCTPYPAAETAFQHVGHVPHTKNILLYSTEWPIYQPQAY